MSVHSRWQGHLKIRRNLLAAAKKRVAAARKVVALRTKQVSAAKRVLRRHPAVDRAPQVMYDSTDLSQIPSTAPAVAGYVGGNWPTFHEIPSRFPHARHVSIAVASYLDADVLDVEPGDAPPEKAPEWVRRQQRRGVKRPILYTSVSQAATLLDILSAHGIHRGDVRLWLAHYTHHEHVCGPGCGFGLDTTADATQWTDRAHGRTLDQSCCRSSFWQ